MPKLKYLGNSRGELSVKWKIC